MEPFELDARDSWNFGADAFIEFVESGADYYRHYVHGPGLLAACGDVHDLTALDLGCGHGYFARLLARAGARVTGVDVSDRLLERAVVMEAADPLGITYVRADAAAIGSLFPPGRFDLVTGCMSLQDVADPGAALAGAAAVLKPGGRATFSVPHPCTDPPVREWRRDEGGRKLALCLDRYFDTGPAVCDWNMPRLKYPWRTPYRRLTLAEWSGLIRAARLTIRGLCDPRPTAELVASRPELEDCARMPYFLVFDLVKADVRG
jgi:SAM-dependent methyltransferase